MKLIFTLSLSFLLYASQGISLEMMKNLELKVQLDEESLRNLIVVLQPYYSEVISQTDTYFVTSEGRLKLREEEGKGAYMIRYLRPNLEQAKESDYLFYPIDDVDLFLSIFKDVLQNEIQVKKERMLYFPKPHIRVHLDRVESLGDFLEIEIILSKEVSLEIAKAEMQALQESLQLNNLNKINCGYRELLQKHKLE